MFDRMSPEKLARVRRQGVTTNELNALAHVASGYGGNGASATNAEKRIAEGLLIDKVGPGKAKQLVRQARRRVVKDTF